MNRLTLWDIDGTLTYGGHGHATAFQVAFEQVFSIHAPVDWDKVQGLTDRQVIKKTLEDQLPYHLIEKRMDQMLEFMQASFADTIGESEIQAHEGVQALLKACRQRRYGIGHVTGNIKPIADMKMKKIGLDQYFQLGGYGNMDESRARLVDIAVNQAKELGLKNKSKVVLFGDTPKDIRAGKIAGVRTIGVATGVYNSDQLRQAGPDYTLENLTDTKNVLELIKSF